ncbi:hypothetical protein EV05_1557 [Prochlorococcus sp. MIT 0601]|nr:hypothetical protein EV05_1557 [Prochlorococcus sp. MIT 0601]
MNAEIAKNRGGNNSLKSHLSRSGICRHFLTNDRRKDIVRVKGFM